MINEINCIVDINDCPIRKNYEKCLLTHGYGCKLNLMAKEFRDRLNTLTSVQIEHFSQNLIAKKLGNTVNLLRKKV